MMIASSPSRLPLLPTDKRRVDTAQGMVSYGYAAVNRLWVVAVRATRMYMYMYVNH